MGDMADYYTDYGEMGAQAYDDWNDRDRLPLPKGTEVVDEQGAIIKILGYRCSEYSIGGQYRIRYIGGSRVGWMDADIIERWSIVRPVQ